MKRKVVIAEPIGQAGVEQLRSAADVAVVELEGPAAVADEVADADALVVRSGTPVTAELVARAGNLKVVVRAGAGVDNIDLEAATAAGVVVMNTPGANTTAATEHTLALLLALARRIPAADRSLRDGRWERKKFTGFELHSKLLGVVGLGRIGTEVAARAQAFKMRVIGYDPFLTRDRFTDRAIEMVELDELLERADVVTLHVPLSDATRGLVGAAELARMKPGAVLLNCARGSLVDEAALVAALDSGHVGGAAIDAFATEPAPLPALVRHPRVVATPHLGASTAEARDAVGKQAARQVLDALDGSGYANAVNLPTHDPEAFARLRPYLILVERMGALQAQLTDGRISAAELEVTGEFDDIAPLRLAFLRGLLAPAVGALSVNYVNAPLLARDRGIKVSESRAATSPLDYTRLVTTTVVTDGGRHVVRGTVFEQRDPHVVEIDGFRLDAIPDGNLVVCLSRDRPGVIGTIGTLFGRHRVNISEFRLGRKDRGDVALSVITLDSAPEPAALDELRKLPELLWATAVTL